MKNLSVLTSIILLDAILFSCSPLVNPSLPYQSSSPITIISNTPVISSVSPSPIQSISAPTSSASQAPQMTTITPQEQPSSINKIGGEEDEVNEETVPSFNPNNLKKVLEDLNDQENVTTNPQPPLAIAPSVEPVSITPSPAQIPTSSPISTPTPIFSPIPTSILTPSPTQIPEISPIATVSPNEILTEPNPPAPQKEVNPTLEITPNIGNSSSDFTLRVYHCTSNSWISVYIKFPGEKNDFTTALYQQTDLNGYISFTLPKSVMATPGEYFVLLHDNISGKNTGYATYNINP